jgi:ribosomal subunit interface protein
MRYPLIGKNLEVTPDLREYFESKVAKLDRLIPAFSDQLVSLQATAEKNPKYHDYSTSLSLHFPSYTLDAEEQSRDLKGAIRTAFDEIIRQVDRFQSMLRGEHRWTAGEHTVNLQDVAPFFASSLAGHATICVDAEGARYRPRKRRSLRVIGKPRRSIFSLAVSTSYTVRRNANVRASASKIA